MAASRFEALLEREMDALANALLVQKTTDPEIARMQAKHAGLKLAMAHYKDVNTRVDDDGDDA